MPPLSEPHVLLVDDHPLNLKVIGRMLEKAGCHVTYAEDGLLAVERVQVGADVVLMDCSMPVCDGFEATRRIRALSAPFNAVPIVALTAHASGADRSRCLAAGMDDWLSKPVTPELLLDAVRRHTGWGGRLDVLDRGTIQQLVALAEGDPEFLSGITEEFEASSAATLDEAIAQQQTADWPTFRRTLHRMRSGASSIGARRLEAACARGEHAGDADLSAHAHEWVTDIANERGAAVRAFAGLLVVEA